MGNVQSINIHDPVNSKPKPPLPVPNSKNNLEFVDEVTPLLNENPFSPKMLPGEPFSNSGVMKNIKTFSYYNPYLKKRVIVKEFKKAIPISYELKYLNLLAIRHYIDVTYPTAPDFTFYNTNPLLINRIIQMLIERDYINNPTPEKVIDVKMHLDKNKQPTVDTIASLLIFERDADPIKRNILQQIIQSLQSGVFEQKGGKRTRRKMSKRKTRGRRRH